MLHALILAGGGGTRLWPMSRGELPKQFLSLLGEKSLLQMTMERVSGMADKTHVVTGSKWEALVRFQAMAIGEDVNIIEEPCGRNTGAAIALGLSQLKAAGCSGCDLVLVCPSDHVISDNKAFENAVCAAQEPASEGRLVTFGIVPVRPDTGYGYIRAGCSHDSWLEAAEFVEKPDEARAAEYVASGRFYWNGGIFLFRIRDMEEALQKYEPALGAAVCTPPAEVFGQFEALPSVPIDVAVFERAQNVAMVPLDAGWSDLGSWDAIHEASCRDERGNAITGDTVQINCRDTMIKSHTRLVTAIDLDGVLIVDSPDALLVSRAGSSQRVREVVSKLKEAQRREVEQTPASARPWGTYRIVTEEPGVKVKRIMVHPGKRLSLQYHHHRNEHWIVLSGTAYVTRGGEGFILHPGESTYITMGCNHRLSNPGKIPLEILEVQQGEYLGEDDITRIEDDHMR